MATNRIGEVMKGQGRTQVFLENEMNKSRTTIYNWYNNISQPNIFQLKKIAELIGVNMEDLV